MKRALITGDQGFVGQHMRRALTEAGWSVDGLDIVDGPSFDVRRVLGGLGVESVHTATVYDLVVHCAAVVGGRQTISHDPLAVAVDLEIDAAVIRWAVRTKQPRLVYFSSCAAYPVEYQNGRRPVPLTEDLLRPIRRCIGLPDLTYGWAKVTGEVLATYAQAAGVNVHIFRPFSGYGPGQALDYPFPTFVARARRRDDPFEVWGDGEQTRDFVHIDDVVATVLTAVEHGAVGPLNIGTGRTTSFNELGRMACATVGHSFRPQHLLSQPTGPRHRVADVSLMNRVRPARITLEQGLAEALQT